MGAYQGSGIVSGGGENIRPLSSISFKDQYGNLNYYYVEQKERQSTTIFPGVAKGTAESAAAESNLSELVLEWWWASTSGGGGSQLWVIPSCKGNKKDVRYTQINGSNLYELDRTDTQLWERHRLNTNGWSGWAGG